MVEAVFAGLFMCIAIAAFVMMVHSDNKLAREVADIMSQDDPAIVQALAIASAAREAGMVDEHGRFRKILGTLPITADGCVVGNHVVSVYYIDKRGKVRESLMLNRSFREPVYSTRSAAEAAKGGGDA